MENNKAQHWFEVENQCWALLGCLSNLHYGRWGRV